MFGIAKLPRCLGMLDMSQPELGNLSSITQTHKEVPISSLDFITVPVRSHHTQHGQPVLTELQGGEVVLLNLTQKLSGKFAKRGLWVFLILDGFVALFPTSREVTSAKGPILINDPSTFHKALDSTKVWKGGKHGLTRARIVNCYGLIHFFAFSLPENLMTLGVWLF